MKASSDLVYKNQLAKLKLPKTPSLIIYDKKLLSHIPFFKSWLVEQGPSYAVSAGESLKSLEHLQKHLKAIDKLGTWDRSATFVAIGGGSVGDFVGFLASIWKRGVKLYHIPTTWLAAMDSAHGGKTALNWRGAKNQLGTFLFC